MLPDQYFVLYLLKFYCALLTRKDYSTEKFDKDELQSIY